MKRSLSYVLFADLVFLILLSASSYFDGIFGHIMYCLSFVVPLLLVYFLVRSKGIECGTLGFKMSKKDLVLTVPTVFPVLAAVFLISYLTSLILSFFADAPATDVSGDFLVAVFLHAVMPSVFEELLFRYVPLKLLSPYGSKNAIFISAVMFSLIHANLFQIPYAFFAGILFAVSDIATGSILPSLILHFLNNFVSICWIRGSSDKLFANIFLFGIIIGALVSLIIIFLFRKKYRDLYKPIFADKSRITFSLEFLLIAAMLFLTAILNLI